MRTKALLLAAATAAAGVATSVAQVYSVNAVGYVNVTLNPGFNLVSNPLDLGVGQNVVSNLFKNITPDPRNIRVLTFNETSGGFNTAATYSPIGTIAWGNTAQSGIEVRPGAGAFVYNPDATGTRTLTFVGEVMQGPLENPIPAGFSIRANQVPQAGAPNTFGMVSSPGDNFFRFNKTTGGYDTYRYGNPGPNWRLNGVVTQLPSIDVGEAFFYYRASGTSATAWSRTFNVNNPS